MNVLKIVHSCMVEAMKNDSSPAQIILGYEASMQLRAQAQPMDFLCAIESPDRFLGIPIAVNGHLDQDAIILISKDN